jgi:hypothetical protein
VKRPYLYATPETDYLSRIEESHARTREEARRWLRLGRVEFVIATPERIERSPVWSAVLAPVAECPVSTSARLYRPIADPR